MRSEEIFRSSEPDDGESVLGQTSLDQLSVENGRQVRDGVAEEKKSSMKLMKGLIQDSEF